MLRIGGRERKRDRFYSPGRLLTLCYGVCAATSSVISATAATDSCCTQRKRTLEVESKIDPAPEDADRHSCAAPQQPRYATTIRQSASPTTSKAQLAVVQSHIDDAESGSSCLRSRNRGLVPGFCIF